MESISAQRLLLLKHIRFSDRENEVSSHFFDFLHKTQLDLARYLADVEIDTPACVFSTQQVRDLEYRILQSSKTRADAALAFSMLGKIIGALNKIKKGPIPEPRLADIRHSGNNPLTETTEAHQKFDAWQGAFDLGLERYQNEKTLPLPLINLGLLMYSGNVLQRDTLIGLLDSRSRTDTSFRYSHRGWLYTDVSLPWGGLPNQAHRRLYFGTPLACLISRTSRDAVLEVLGANSNAHSNQALIAAATKRTRRERKEIGVRISNQIVTELRKLGVSADLLPKSLHDLTQTVAVVLVSEVPAVFVEYWLRRLDSRSLLPHCSERINYELSTLPPLEDIDWGAVRKAQVNRIVDGAAMIETSQISSGPTAMNGVQPIELELKKGVDVDSEPFAEAYGGECPQEREPEWMESLRHALGKTTKGKAIHELTKVQQEYGEHSFAGWLSVAGICLLREKNSSGRSLKLSSVKSCVLTVARRLGRQLQGKDLVEFPAQALHDTYLSVFELAWEGTDPRRMVRHTTWALRECHRVWRRVCGAPALEESAVFKAVPGLLPVDAKICSLDDIYDVVQSIKTDSTVSVEYRRMALAGVIFAFFGGVRRMEGLGLERRDYPGGFHSPLFIRAWDGRGLKTSNAKRWVSMRVQSRSDFLNTLNDWASEVLQGRGHFLFSRESDPKSGVSESVIVPIIHRALAKVCGENVTWHSLRHSFSHWVFFRLMLSDLPEIPELFPHLKLTSAWLREAQEFRVSLYGNDLVSNDHAWVVAALIGHSTPLLSLQHYIHCLDVLGPLFLANSKIFGLKHKHNKRDLWWLSGLNHSTAYRQLGSLEDQPRLKSRWGEYPSDLAERFAYQLCVDSDRLGVPEIGGVELKRDKIEPDHSSSWLKETHDLLNIIQVSGEAAYLIAASLSMEADVAELIETRAPELFSSNTVEEGTEDLPEILRSHKELMLPVRPTLPEALPLLGQLAERIEEHANYAECAQSGATKPLLGRERLSRTLDHFMRNRVGRSLAVKFADLSQLNEAKDHKELICSLGVKIGSIRYSCNNADSQKKWARALDLYFRDGDWMPLPERPKQISDELTIMVSANLKLKEGKRLPPRTVEDVLRFVLEMAAVRFSRSQEIPSDDMSNADN